MTRPNLPILTLLLCVLTASTALALGGDHGKAKIAKDYNKKWPEGLSDLINSVERVWGHWVNQGDFFYYQGDAAALNKFLVAYGKLPNTPLAVVLHAAVRPKTGPLSGAQSSPYDWQLEIMRRGWGAPIDPRLPEKEPGYVVTVHVWLGDGITLESLDIPKHVEARSAQEIERFIEKHREKIR